MLKRNKNLIICLTPLQMLIMEAIIRAKKDEERDYTFICICYNYNEKYNMYFNRFKKNVGESFLYEVSSISKIGRFFDLLKYKREIVCNINSKFDNIYFASIDNPFVQLVLSEVEYDHLISFDDGTANLWANSSYNKPIGKSNMQKLLSKIVGIKLNVELIKMKTTKHYTIFNNNNYLKNKSEFISIFNIKVEENINHNKIKIFLGQPLSDYDFSLFSKENIDIIVKMLKIDFYFPHPREKEILSTIEVIETNKIFEDYIVELLAKNYNVEVYTFFSSAALTVVGLQNVKVYSLFDNIVFNRFSELFLQFKENGVNLINLDHENEN